MQLAQNDAKELTPGFIEVCQEGRSFVGHYHHSVYDENDLVMY
jgi:hypothetical protein